MPHIFFEKLENRRSTQSLYGGYTTPSNDFVGLYGAASAPYGISIPNPLSTGFIPSWSTGYNPYTSFNPYQSYNPFSSWNTPFNQSYTNPFSSWNTPFNQYSYTNPFPSFLGGIGSLFSPFLNNFRGLFGWPSPTLPINSYPGYTNPGNIFPGDIRALYGISVNPIPPTPYTSYTPPDSGGWLLYGINLPTSYAPPTSTNLYLYGVDIPPGNSSAVFKI